MKTPTQLELDSLDYDCPHCHVLAGSWCRTKEFRILLRGSKRYPYSMHVARQRLVR